MLLARRETSSKPNGNVFVQFLDTRSASKLLEASQAEGLYDLGRYVEAKPGRRDTDPDWLYMSNPPSDTLRAWNLPLRALIDEDLMMRAFGRNNKLISIRVGKSN
jgi:hypothetical protein